VGIVSATFTTSLHVINAFTYSCVPQNLYLELYNALIDSVTDVYSDESVLQDYVVNDNVIK
jgi:hypothetical protein